MGKKGVLELQKWKQKWKNPDRVIINYDDNSLTISPNSEIAFVIPEGYSSIRGAVKNTEANHRAEMVTLNSINLDRLKPYYHKLSLNIPKKGKLSATFPYNCNKSNLLAKNYVNFLLKYKGPDGEWPRWGNAWTHGSFDTAMIGLALLSMGDEALMPEIRRAVQHVIDNFGASRWTITEATKILFLSEYYLRTKDRKVLIPLQKYVNLAQDSVLTGFYLGHKYGNPGYSGKGMSVGFAYALLALTVASHTDIKVNSEILKGMHDTAARLGTQYGALPYGRFWTPDMNRGIPTNATAPNSALPGGCNDIWRQQTLYS